MKTLNQYGEYNFFGHNKLKIGKIIIYNILIIISCYYLSNQIKKMGKTQCRRRDLDYIHPVKYINKNNEKWFGKWVANLGVPT